MLFNQLKIKNWTYFSLHCSTIFGGALLFWRFPAYARLSFW